MFSPKAIPTGYKKVVYLDRPLNFIHDKINAVCTNLSGINKYQKLSVNRDDFKVYYELFSALDNKPFTDVLDFIKNTNTSDYEQSIFSLVVFFELGFFDVQNGRFNKLCAPKNALTNSTTYCKISNIKG